MERPPSVNEISDMLLEMRSCLDADLQHLQHQKSKTMQRHREMGMELDSDLAHQVAMLRNQVRQKQRDLDLFPQTVYRTIVVEEETTGRREAVALVPPQCSNIEPFVIRSWMVHVMPGSLQFNRCQTGDMLNIGLVVSVDGGPILSEGKRRKAYEKSQELHLNLREQHKLDRIRRRMLYDNFQQERQDRERERQDELEHDRLMKLKREREASPRPWSGGRAIGAPVAVEEAPVAEPIPAYPGVEIIPIEEHEPEMPYMEHAVEVEELDEPAISARIYYATLLGAFSVGSLGGFLFFRPYFSMTGLGAAALTWIGLETYKYYK